MNATQSKPYHLPFTIPSEYWTGWYRPRGTKTWILFAADVDEWECHRLLDLAPRGGDYTVLWPWASDPNLDRRVR